MCKDIEIYTEDLWSRFKKRKKYIELIHPNQRKATRKSTDSIKIRGRVL